MKFQISKKTELCAVFFIALSLWLLEMMVFTDTAPKVIPFCFGLAAVALLLFWSPKPMWNLSTVLLMSYVVFAGFGAVYAMSGKFFLREFSKLIMALPIFLYIQLKPEFDRDFVHRVLKVLACVSAIVAFVSVEMVTTGLTSWIVAQIDSMSTLNMGYMNRLYGIYGNSNVEASVYAIGILSALAALNGAKTKADRVFSMVLCSISAFAFLLCISVGATICFALAVIVYLIAAGKQRLAVLLRMLFVAVPTVVFAALSGNLLWRENALHMIPLLLMVLNAAVSVVLELRVMDRVSAKLESHAKLPLLIMLALMVLVAVYLTAAVNLTSTYTFSARGDSLYRVDYTAAGDHTLTVASDGDVTVEITAQNRYDILQGKFTELYKGPASGVISYTVPEGTTACNYRFSAEAGTQITEASIDGATKLPLKYLLLPAFVADRLQGAWTSDSLVVREALWDYGLRLFRMSPVIGNGYGAYESGMQRVEDIVFESKYVHNHYIQVLLESGIIGFALYVGALLSMAVALIRKRHFVEDAELGWTYPALAACFVMICTVTLWDISMSRAVYLCMAYAVFALLIRLFASPLPTKQPAQTDGITKKEMALLEQKSRAKEWIISIVCAMFPALFLVTLGANMLAQNLLSKPVTTYSEFYNNAMRAAELDPYEYNDAKMSFILNVSDEYAEEHYGQANEYAEEMLQSQSNSIPRMVQQYYTDTRQYDKAIGAAMKGAEYSAADPDTWNTCFSLLWNGVVLNNDALQKDMDTLLPLLMEYRDMFDARNATAIEPITLEEPALSCYNMLGVLNEKEQSGRQEAEEYLQLILDDYYQVMEEVLAEPAQSANE